MKHFHKTKASAAELLKHAIIAWWLTVNLIINTFAKIVKKVLKMQSKSIAHKTLTCVLMQRTFLMCFSQVEQYHNGRSFSERTSYNTSIYG